MILSWKYILFLIGVKHFVTMWYLHKVCKSLLSDGEDFFKIEQPTRHLIECSERVPGIVQLTTLLVEIIVQLANFGSEFY